MTTNNDTTAKRGYLADLHGVLCEARKRLQDMDDSGAYRVSANLSAAIHELSGILNDRARATQEGTK